LPDKQRSFRAVGCGLIHVPHDQGARMVCPILPDWKVREERFQPNNSLYLPEFLLFDRTIDKL
jgi:hypothetical protein